MWQFKNASWDQDEESHSFRLSELNHRQFTQTLAAPLDLLLGAKNHPPSQAPCANGFFPAEFVFCPNCGDALVERGPKESEPWIPPFGPGNGIKVLNSELKLDPLVESQGETFVLPSMSGAFSFVTARLGGMKRLLMAVQRDVGQLWVHAPQQGQQWAVLDGRFGESKMPNWAWSLALDVAEQGLAIPTINGPAWVTVDWVRNQLIVDCGAGQSIGGASRLKDLVLAPVMRDGQFAMLSRKDGATTWSECAALSDPLEVAPQLRRRQDQEPYFGTPVVDESRLVAYWPCRGGYVKVVYQDVTGMPAWTFRPWNSSSLRATALVEIGVPYRKTGSRPGLWQLCEDDDTTSRDGIVNKIIKFDGDEVIDTEVVEIGQFLTTGRASFSWLYDHWTDVHQHNTNIGEQTDLRYPILQFGDKGLVLLAKVRAWEGREDMGQFTDLLHNRSQKATAFVRFVIQGASCPEKPLFAHGVEGSGNAPGSLFRISISQLSEISAFIYDAQLYLYFAEDNTCFRWPLELVGA